MLPTSNFCAHLYLRMFLAPGHKRGPNELPCTTAASRVDTVLQNKLSQLPNTSRAHPNYMSAAPAFRTSALAMSGSGARGLLLLLLLLDLCSVPIAGARTGGKHAVRFFSILAKALAESLWCIMYIMVHEHARSGRRLSACVSLVYSIHSIHSSLW